MESSHTYKDSELFCFFFFFNISLDGNKLL